MLGWLFSDINKKEVVKHNKESKKIGEQFAYSRIEQNTRCIIDFISNKEVSDYEINDLFNIQIDIINDFKIISLDCIKVKFCGRIYSIQYNNTRIQIFDIT